MKRLVFFSILILLLLFGCASNKSDSNDLNLLDSGNDYKSNTENSGTIFCERKSSFDYYAKYNVFVDTPSNIINPELFYAETWAKDTLLEYKYLYINVDKSIPGRNFQAKQLDLLKKNSSASPSYYVAFDYSLNKMKCDSLQQYYHTALSDLIVYENDLSGDYLDTSAGKCYFLKNKINVGNSNQIYDDCINKEYCQFFVRELSPNSGIVVTNANSSPIDESIFLKPSEC